MSWTQLAVIYWGAVSSFTVAAWYYKYEKINVLDFIGLVLVSWFLAPACILFVFCSDIIEQIGRRLRKGIPSKPLDSSHITVFLKNQTTIWFTDKEASNLEVAEAVAKTLEKHGYKAEVYNLDGNKP